MASAALTDKATRTTTDALPPLESVLDVDSVECALTVAHDAVEAITWGLRDINEYVGNEPELEPITDSHIASAATIRRDLQLRIEQLSAFAKTVDDGLDCLIVLKTEQGFRR